jgi:NAD-dependent deacetylase
VPGKYAETMKQTDDTVAGAAERLAGARRIVVFTGAGVSTDSGIPDFRSPDGIWRRYDPRQFTLQRYLSDPEARRQSWRLRREFQAMRPRPNAAHHACARLAEAGRLEGVVTQNIDGLHGDAGLDPGLICELHGNGRWVACLSCGDRMPMAEAVARVDAGEDDPACLHCGGILKATTVSFGQSLPPEAWARAEAMAAGCDAFLAVGSSLVVYPAASLPELASERGATLVIVNREPTPLDPLADVTLRGECGVLLPALVDALLEAR